MDYIDKTNLTKKSFDLFWWFLKQPINANLKDVLSQIHLFNRITLPHDWLIYDVNQLYETSSGWYFKKVNLKKNREKKYFIYFEGVYQDSTLFVNGHRVGSWKNGYTSFEMDITDYLLDGQNHLVMQVKHEHPNSRWYSGAGIYRHVWWIEKNQQYIKTHGIYVVTKSHEEDWVVDVETNVQSDQPYQVVQTLYYSGVVCSKSEILGKHGIVHQQFEVKKPRLWSVEQPYLYDLETTLLIDHQIVDQITQKIGFKHVVMDPDHGLFVNGKHMKIKGVCEHHDLGLLGAAFSKTVLKNRMILLKEMGVNAIRTAHSVPAPDVMNLADEMGFLIVSEAFDMWEKPKNMYDYARFFRTWVDRDVESWITRDRNHVSLLMWSIGNEIQDTNVVEHGLFITKRLVALVEKYDPNHNGVITLGSNFMMDEHTRSCVNVLQVAGYNYGELLYKAQHKQYPKWRIYGSETSSILQSRGIYHFPLSQAVLADEDMQCSSLGNSSPSWGAKSIEKILTFDRDLLFSMGQFIWTGFDYIGESTPYETKNSYFGQLDTAGFKKDSFYVYQAAWTDGKTHPMIHVFPYWQFNEGEMIDVRVCSNAQHIELYLDNELIGKKTMDMSKDLDVLPTWQLPFKRGVLKAIAYDDAYREVACDIRPSFGNTHAIKVSMDKEIMVADGKDLIEIIVEAHDKQHFIVENGKIPITIDVEGPIKVLGMDNGDSSDLFDYKNHVKSMFSGKLKIIIGSLYQSGIATIIISSPDIESIKFNVKISDLDTHDEEIEHAKALGYTIRSGEFSTIKSTSLHDLTPIESIDLSSDLPRIFTKDHQTFDIKAKIQPVNATQQDLVWKVVSEKGIALDIAALQPYENGCRVSAKGDGKFIVRCTVNNHKSHPDVMSNLLFEAQGIGTMHKNPYVFVIAGLFDRSIGDIKTGQAQGVALNQAQDAVVFDHVDFGRDGSNTIKLSIFAFESEPLEIDVYQGHPHDKKAQLIDTLYYHKETKWNVFQDETYTLSKRFEGVSSIGFVFSKGVVHFRGFVFEQQNRAYEKLSILSCDTHVGHQYIEEPWGYSNIGNNVSFGFERMNFSQGISHVEICGHSPIDKHAIKVQFKQSNGDKQSEVIYFNQSLSFETKTFKLNQPNGIVDVEFIFLPGSKFDFQWLKFSV